MCCRQVLLRWVTNRESLAVPFLRLSVLEAEVPWPWTLRFEFQVERVPWSPQGFIPTDPGGEPSPMWKLLIELLHASLGFHFNTSAFPFYSLMEQTEAGLFSPLAQKFLGSLWT